MECAAVAFAKYSRFAARARMDENWELARKFQQTADTERLDRFAREAKMEDLIEGCGENLGSTIEAERKQLQIFNRFAEEAKEDKDLDAACEFERIRREKERRCARFERILENIGVHCDAQMVGGSFRRGWDGDQASDW